MAWCPPGCCRSIPAELCFRMARGGVLATILILVLAFAAGAVRGAYAPPSERALRYPGTAGVWGPAEYGAIEVILRLESVESYPRLASRATAAVFRKIIDGGNLAHVRNTSVPLLRRLIDLRSYDGYIGGIRARYNLHVQRGAPLQSELVRLQIFLLELCALTVEMNGPFIAALHPNERRKLQQMAFLDTFGTLRTHVSGVVASLGETTIYSDTQRAELAKALGRTVPALHGLFTPAERRRIAAQILELAAVSTNPSLRQTLIDVAESMAM